MNEKLVVWDDGFSVVLVLKNTSADALEGVDGETSSVTIDL